jgi:hypothetical protein
MGTRVEKIETRATQLGGYTHEHLHTRLFPVHTPTMSFTPDQVRMFYNEALERERALSSKYFMAAITWKGGFQEYNRLMDLNAAAQARAMALWQEMDAAIEIAEHQKEKEAEFEAMAAAAKATAVWNPEGCVELKPTALKPKTTFRRIVVKKLPAAIPA